MAAPEDDAFEGGYDAKAADTQCRPGQAVMVRGAPAERADWIKVLFGLLARRARVSPA